jgi:hypothetical protein
MGSTSSSEHKIDYVTVKINESCCNSATVLADKKLSSASPTVNESEVRIFYRIEI